MKRFSELASDAKLIEVLRWVCVLPAAVLGAFVVQYIVHAVVQIADYGGWDLRDSSLGYALRVFIYYVLRKAAFVIAGAKMAPRHQVATAIVLAVLGILSSLMIHIAGQHLVGNYVGLVNYTHFLAESAGALGGAAGIAVHDWRKRRTGVPA